MRWIVLTLIALVLFLANGAVHGQTTDDCRRFYDRGLKDERLIGYTEENNTRVTAYATMYLACREANR